MFSTISFSTQFFILPSRSFGFLFRYIPIMWVPPWWNMTTVTFHSNLRSFNCPHFAYEFHKSLISAEMCHMKVLAALENQQTFKSTLLYSPVGFFLSAFIQLFEIMIGIQHAASIGAYIQLHTYVLHSFFFNSFPSKCLSSNAFEVWQIMWILNV